MSDRSKTKQIAVRFSKCSYEKISFFSEEEHRGLGEFVRHATLFYIKHLERQREDLEKE